MDFQDIDTLRNEDECKEYAVLKLYKMGNMGTALAAYKGVEIEVLGGINQELVKARIYRFTRKKKPVIVGIVVEVLQASEYRIQPLCPYYGPCSGCQLQHIKYEKQLLYKKQLIMDQFSEYSNLEHAIILNTIPSPDQWNYRNHARFTVRFNGQLGFSNRITKRFVRVDKCMLMNDGINDVLDELQDLVEETTSISVRNGINTDEILIQPKLYSDRIDLETGQKWYTEILNDKKFRIASPSFFQVNTLQAEKMILLVGDLLQLTKTDVLVDAYSGVGVFATLLANRVKKVIAIEESFSAIEDGESDSSNTGNLQFMMGKTEHVLPEIMETIDALILDPPRVGCHPDVINSILKVKPRRIAYVSCDPETLARDLDKLVAGGYITKQILPIDMFPQTYHVESISLLCLKNS